MARVWFYSIVTSDYTPSLYRDIWIYFALYSEPDLVPTLYSDLDLVPPLYSDLILRPPSIMTSGSTQAITSTSNFASPSYLWIYTSYYIRKQLRFAHLLAPSLLHPQATSLRSVTCSYIYMQLMF